MQLYHKLVRFRLQCLDAIFVHSFHFQLKRVIYIFLNGRVLSALKAAAKVAYSRSKLTCKMGFSQLS